MEKDLIYCYHLQSRGPGVILYGANGKSVLIPGVRRKLFLCPYPHTSGEDILNELREYGQVGETKIVKRNYAFSDPRVPRGSSTFVKLTLPTFFDATPNYIGKTYSCILGSDTSVLEAFIIGRGLHLPAWLCILHDMPMNDKCVLQLDSTAVPEIEVPSPPSLRIGYLHADSAATGIALEIDGDVRYLTRLNTAGQVINDKLRPDIVIGLRVVRSLAALKVSLNPRILVCDLETFSSTIVRKPITSYSLSDLYEHFVGKEALLHRGTHPLEILRIVKEVALKSDALVISQSLTSIAGNTWYGTLNCRRAERVDYLLSHAFKKLKFVLPERRWQSKRGLNEDDDEDEDDPRAKEEEYDDDSERDEENEQVTDDAGETSGSEHLKGGSVLEPKLGLHDSKSINIYDFRSLYPSIFIEYGLCFVDEAPVLPKIISSLMQLRQESSTTSPCKQYALKLIMNSIYGCIASKFSRYSNRELAAVVTAHGRRLLARAAKIANDAGFPVIFGDTDSIAIEAMPHETDGILARINAGFSCIYMRLDQQFDSIYVLGKKRYAICSGGEIQVKGLEIVKRNMCGVAKKAGMRLLRMIFEKQKALQVEDLSDIADWAFETARFPEDYWITSLLSKDPKSFVNEHGVTHLAGLHHVRAALVANSTLPNNLCYSAGDYVKYAVLKGIDNVHFPSPGCIKVSVAVEDVTEIDTDWYRKEQVEKVLQRIAMPILFKDDTVALVLRAARQLVQDKVSDLLDSIEAEDKNKTCVSLI
jgi:DNA polymerase elongation subunit (family B)